MRSSWLIEQMKFPDHEKMLMAREVAELLQKQEQLLACPMSTKDVTVYEIRSQQISELIAKLG